MTIAERKQKLFENYLIPVIKRKKSEIKWDWKSVIIPQQKGEKKEDISNNIDSIVYG